MAIISEGIFGEWGPPKLAHDAVHAQINQYVQASEVHEDDYCVDIAFLTGASFGEDLDPPIGATAGPVGRRILRFIVWHRLPLGLADARSVREWFVETLLETERLVREHLPTKSRKYPAQDLAEEIADLRDYLRSLDT